jgi:hypothetical protein
MQVAVYPRGFLGFDIGINKGDTKASEFMQTIKGLEFNRTIQPSTSAHPSNPNIDELWQQYIGGSSFISSFAFREKILLNALKCFGTDNFYDWCLLQVKNPFATPMHTKFINDTLRFIGEGTRSVSVTSWSNLLNINNKPSVGVDNDIALKTFFRTNLPNEMQKQRDMTSIVICWTSQEGGFEDLLATMYILFGKLG